MSGIVIGPRAYATSTESMRFVGQNYLFPQGISSKTLPMTKMVMLKGGSYWVSNSTIGDTITLSVVNENQDEVSVYCENIPVPPFSGIQIIDSPTVGLIPAGYALKVTYNNKGSMPVDMGLTYSWFEV